MGSVALMSTAYLPPVQFFSKFFLYDKIIIEKQEHFVKQTYRNRCSIYGANGKLDLAVPLQHSTERTPIHQKKISYNDNWQALHWKTICSAYRSSPYFEYFESDFEDFYNKEYEFLFDYNFELLQFICRLLKISPSFSFTEQYEKHPEGVDDLRMLISPKNHLGADENFQIVEYYQVFGNKHGFLSNLSIIDLVFNEGLKSLEILKASVIG